MIMTTTKTKISSKSITFYLAALRSYFAYYDVDVIPSKFTRKVKVPKVMREDLPLYYNSLFCLWCLPLLALTIYLMELSFCLSSSLRRR